MITVGFSTREDNQKYIDYIQKTSMYKEVQIIQKINNGEKSLSQVYNEIIEESENDIVVLIHDDLEFETKNWGEKLIKSFEKNPEYSILGLAGTKFLDKSAKWWTVPSTMYGIVNHKHEGKKWTSTYSPDLGQKVEEVALVDGLFIAFNKKNIKHKFDETIEGFHFYDLGFCIPNFLEGVKIGVTNMVRVTHLSVGQTNDQWEQNRENFSKKYSDILPLDITKKGFAHTYIFCHDQDLILGFEKNKKFENLHEYTYVFLGQRPVDKLTGLPNVIIARDLEHNLEQYPLFTSYTGWYALWKNNLLDSQYLNLFEYDTMLDPYFEQNHSKFYEANSEMIGYVPFPISHFQFIQNRDWVEYLIPSIKKNYNVDVDRFYQDILKRNPQAFWSSTSNTTFRKDIFEEYMKWFEPMIDDLKDTKTCGHAHERSISIFAHLKKKKLFLTQNLLKHLQLDSHKTQGHSVNMEQSINKLMNVQS